jgi:hypothetical protein
MAHALDVGVGVASDTSLLRLTLFLQIVGWEGKLLSVTATQKN